MIPKLALAGQRPRSFGPTLSAIVTGAPRPITRVEASAGQRYGPGMPRIGDAPAVMPFLDNSPPELPPANTPGGNQPTPILPKPVERTDYAEMLNQALGPPPKMSTGQKIAAIIGPALMAASGNEAGATQMISAIRARHDDYARQQRENALTAIKLGRDDDLAQAKANEPQYWSGNEDRVRFEPATGTATRVYDAPQDFEDYARASGFEPGTPEYFKAAEDYVLRGNGSTAFKYDRDVEVIRQANRAGLEGIRQRNRESLRGMPSDRDTQPRAPRASSARPTATGPNGQKVEWNGTAWVPVR